MPECITSYHPFGNLQLLASTSDVQLSKHLADAAKNRIKTSRGGNDAALFSSLHGQSIRKTPTADVHGEEGTPLKLQTAGPSLVLSMYSPSRNPTQWLGGWV